MKRNYVTPAIYFEEQEGCEDLMLRGSQHLEAGVQEYTDVTDNTLHTGIFDAIDGNEDASQGDGAGTGDEWEYDGL